MKFPVATFVCQPRLSLGIALSVVMTGGAHGLSLRPTTQVDATGIYFDQVVAGDPAGVPHLRLAPAPALGRVVSWTPAQINALLIEHAPELATTNWEGAAQVRIARRTRQLTESDLKELLTASLQQDYVKDRGELELRFTRAVPAAVVPDEPLTVKLLELPNAGVTPNFIARFELRAGDEVAGQWQIPVQASVWREVWVAAGNLKRGQLARDAALSRDRRDLLVNRDALTAVDLESPALEVAENLAPGMPLTSRSLRLRPLVHRGRLAEAIVRDGALTVSVKVEVLEDGLPGQLVRVRNVKSKREFRGTVQNEATILVTL
jgi:flagella basal body P-ring formation protein FlgA